ncbi:MAG: DUF3536 domain-containing protein [Chloroflexi bacterium]|nr:DUF3536 domain-containing protein [Chloroflexota bacterium]
MTRGRLVVHGHFYQPSRIDPFSGSIPADPAAAPAHDWTARVSDECYRPNAEIGNLARISWDVGPTLAGWLERHDEPAHRAFVDAGARGNGLAVPFHHSILPLAAAHDRRTEIRWGLRDFELRFGRPANGMWLPETAVDLPTLQRMAEAGIRHTILAPWQVRGDSVDTRRPYRVELGDGRHIVVALYDDALSGSVSFDPSSTTDADRFARERLLPRFLADPPPDLDRPLIVIATDGELYGHHQPFRELFLHRLVQPRPDEAGHGFDLSPLADALAEPAGHPFEPIRIAERTSWSCHHGIQRWSGDCACVTDAAWKGPLRAALDRLAAGIDAVSEHLVRDLPGEPDPWAARDDYVDVVVGAEAPDAWADRWLDGRGDGDARNATARDTLLGIMETQRWRLAMFSSDGWFWEDPTRPETRSILRAAGWAARRMDALAGSGLERRLLADLATVRSPVQAVDGAGIYRRALTEVGQPAG